MPLHILCHCLFCHVYAFSCNLQYAINTNTGLWRCIVQQLTIAKHITYIWPLYQLRGVILVNVSHRAHILLCIKICLLNICGKYAMGDLERGSNDRISPGGGVTAERKACTIHEYSFPHNDHCIMTFIN